MVTQVSKALANVCYEQQEIISVINYNYKLKERAIFRTTVKEGSSGNDKIRFVYQVASDESSCIASVPWRAQTKTSPTRSY